MIWRCPGNSPAAEAPWLRPARRQLASPARTSEPPPRRPRSDAANATSIPFRRSGIGVVDDAAVAAGHARDLGHVGVGKLEVEDRHVLCEPLDPAGARDDDDALLHQEAQARLRRGLAVRLA